MSMISKEDNEHMAAETRKQSKTNLLQCLLYYSFAASLFVLEVCLEDENLLGIQSLIVRGLENPLMPTHWVLKVTIILIFSPEKCIISCLIHSAYLSKEDKPIVYTLSPEKPEVLIEEWFKKASPSKVRRSDGVRWELIWFLQKMMHSACGNNGNLLSRIFVKNFVKQVTHGRFTKEIY